MLQEPLSIRDFKTFSFRLSRALCMREPYLFPSQFFSQEQEASERDLFSRMAIVGIGRPYRTFPLTPPGIRIRTKNVLPVF
jgi:hypothetical protein